MASAKLGRRRASRTAGWPGAPEGNERRGAPRTAVAALVALLGLPWMPVAAAAQAPGPLPGGLRPGGAGAEHNPVFGLGPQTIWKGGFGVELEGEITRRKGELREEELALHAELLYGLTQDLSLTVSVPLVQRKSESGLVPGAAQVSRDATGVGDALVRAKWRIWHRFSGSTQYHAALIGGVKVPVASTSSEPPLGSGSTDFLGGATISRDGLRYYLWASALVRVNGEAFDRRRGNEYRYDAAVGIRPWIPEYTGVDPLLLLELNGVTADPRVVSGVERAGTGGTVLALSPGFWLTYRNYALKGGIKLPVLQDLGSEESELDYTAVLAIETHL